MIRWITEENFGELDGLEIEGGLKAFAELEGPEDEIEYRIDYNTLTPAQKKKLPGMGGEFNVYTNEKSRPPASLKDRVVKERFYPKRDIIPLIKTILKEKDREKVLAELIEADISPIVLEIWLLKPFSNSEAATKTLIDASLYIYSKKAYYNVIASDFIPGDKKVKFSFPRKVRG